MTLQRAPSLSTESKTILPKLAVLSSCHMIFAATTPSSSARSMIWSLRASSLGAAASCPGICFRNRVRDYGNLVDLLRTNSQNPTARLSITCLDIVDRLACVLDSFGGVLHPQRTASRLPGRIVGHNERLELCSQIMNLFTTLPFQA